MILLDNNVLARMTNDGHANCPIARAAIHKLLRSGEQLVVCPQAIYEFWAVATRHISHNGLGLTDAQAAQWIAFFRRRFLLLPDPTNLALLFVNLVKDRHIHGFRAHDARYVAFAQAHGITQLLTFDPTDFNALPIELLDPIKV